MNAIKHTTMIERLRNRFIFVVVACLLTIAGLIYVSTKKAHCAYCPVYTCYGPCGGKCQCVTLGGQMGGMCVSVERVEDYKRLGYEEMR